MFKKIKTRTAEITMLKKLGKKQVKKKFITTLELNTALHCEKYPCICNQSIDNIFNNEVQILKKLEKYKTFPKIISIDKENHSFIMAYCGPTLKTLINKNRLITKLLKISYNNLVNQITKISNYLDDNFIQHYDLCQNNICFYRKKIYIIDFVCNNKDRIFFLKGENYKKIKNIFDIILEKTDIEYKIKTNKQYGT